MSRKAQKCKLGETEHWARGHFRHTRSVAGNEIKKSTTRQ